MSYVVVNAISVPAENAEAMAERFANRAGMVEQADGFEEFRLLRPADDHERWLVMTTWKDEASFQNWLNSREFGHGHGGPQGGGGPSPASGNEIWTFSVAQRVAK